MSDERKLRYNWTGFDGVALRERAETEAGRNVVSQVLPDALFVEQERHKPLLAKLELPLETKTVIREYAARWRARKQGHIASEYHGGW